MFFREQQHYFEIAPVKGAVIPYTPLVARPLSLLLLLDWLLTVCIHTAWSASQDLKWIGLSEREVVTL